MSSVIVLIIVVIVLVVAKRGLVYDADEISDDQLLFLLYSLQRVQMQWRLLCVIHKFVSVTLITQTQQLDTKHYNTS